MSQFLGPSSYLRKFALVAVGLGLAYVLLSYLERGESQFTDAIKSLAVGEMSELEVFSTPEMAPDVAVYDQDGMAVKLSDFRGSALVVNFWATWCAPCIHEMPSLDRLSAALSSRDMADRDTADRDIAIITVSLDREGFAAVSPFYDQLDLQHLPAFHDRAASLAMKVGAVVLPTTIFIDKQGRMVARLAVPAKWDTPDAAKLIEAIAAY